MQPNALPRRLDRPALVGHTISNRHWAMALTGLAAATAALVGLYPQFDRGSLRVILALTSVPFGMLVMWVALLVRTRLVAVPIAIGLAGFLGFASTVVPALVLAEGKPSVAAGFLVFGAMYGGPTGIVYGLPVALHVYLVHPSTQRSSFDASDAGAARTSLWCSAVAAFSLFMGRALESPAETTTAALVVLVAAGAHGLFTGGRCLARRAWIARVHAGKEPRLRVRPVGARDDDALPRLADGDGVVELIVPRRDGAYRDAAGGIALAIVSRRS